MPTKNLIKSICNKYASKSYANPTQKVFYLHIPKCGGSSIKQSLIDLYSPKLRATIEPEASQDAAKLLGLDWHQECEAMLAYHMHRSNCQCITGHFLWSDACYERFGEDWVFVTLLRNPVDRWLSNYFYDRYKIHSNFHKIDMELEEFLQTKKAKRFGTNLVRFLSGSPQANEQAVEAAKGNLAKLHVVGFLENLVQFQNDLQYTLDCSVNIPHKNSSPRKDLLENCRDRDAVMTSIRNLCAPDIEVYEHAQALRDKGLISTISAPEPVPVAEMTTQAEETDDCGANDSIK